ncbi:hypothetical protein [Sphingomonas faeni]|uniref:hypothetical protein n=1 Tax=Sphingomonas faeni TaxID=185950 RepID=UPI0020C17D02|nr:hypothetical protein [Sphingomonas faeni]MCK8456099.1 hypothetical protein [Sphingomonas faeni]
MTVIAAKSLARGAEYGFGSPWLAQVPVTESAVGTPIYPEPDLDDPVGTAASPWRAPCFYLAFIAGAVLVLAVGVIVAWRSIARRTRRPDDTAVVAMAPSPAQGPDRIACQIR